MFFGANVERDPEINQLRDRVNQELWDIVQESTPKEEQQPKEEIRFVSFEDALKELAALKNS
jgi:hypothetical protein